MPPVKTIIDLARKRAQDMLARPPKDVVEAQAIARDFLLAIEMMEAVLKRIATDNYTKEDESIQTGTPTVIWQALAARTIGLPL